MSKFLPPEALDRLNYRQLVRYVDGVLNASLEDGSILDLALGSFEGTEKVTQQVHPTLHVGLPRRDSGATRFTDYDEGGLVRTPEAIHYQMTYRRKTK